MSAPPTRRWPPAVAIVIGFLMTFTALPNPLKIPNQNPTATAELAPVPGDSDQSNPQSNFSETGFADSGLGSEAEGLAELPPLPPAREVPTNVECVGDPPRQTEDPMSPPCVPFFSGDNLGETYTGVYRNEIVVVFYNDLDVKGDMNQPYKPSDESGNQALYEQVNLVKTIKAQLNYFQRRFQTYGRRVRLIAQPSSGSTPDARRRDAAASFFKYRPFAAVYLGDNAQEYFEKLAEYGVPSFGLNFDVPRAKYEDAAPYIWSFISDQESEASWSASFLCRTLLGRDGPSSTSRLRARFAGDEELRDSPRKIGLIYNTKNVQRGNVIDQNAANLIREVKQQCGYTFDKIKAFQGNGAKEAAQYMAEFKIDGVTTVVCYCIPVPTEVSVSTIQGAASTAEYHPEWYWDHASAMDRPIWLQTFGSREQPSFGVTYFWRQPAFRSQRPYVSYQEETKDGSVPNVRFNFTIYNLYLNLFTAVQAAGPRLDPETVERGMFTFKYTSPKDPWLPTGGYGPDGPGTYTFIDTAMAWWWDPNGTPPGSPKQGEGCQRLLHEGRRFGGPDAVKRGVAPAWPLGDDALAEARERGPCTEDTRKLQDPQPGDVH